eukprot:comp16445_c0_seq1/m.26320 comp16445_c0_seq1/g.26320  ORF comp16445_c0_seq1/g.26320 comp16445_c0_seq1/m.26320 type:complete len:267 (-) comp16445_c0_seq1:14-814(-)
MVHRVVRLDELGPHAASIRATGIITHMSDGEFVMDDGFGVARVAYGPDALLGPIALGNLVDLLAVHASNTTTAEAVTVCDDPMTEPVRMMELIDLYARAAKDPPKENRKRKEHTSACNPSTPNHNNSNTSAFSSNFQPGTRRVPLTSPSRVPGDSSSNFSHPHPHSNHQNNHQQNNNSNSIHQMHSKPVPLEQHLPKNPAQIIPAENINMQVLENCIRSAGANGIQLADIVAQFQRCTEADIREAIDSLVLDGIVYSKVPGFYICL